MDCPIPLNILEEFILDDDDTSFSIVNMGQDCRFLAFEFVELLLVDDAASKLLNLILFLPSRCWENFLGQECLLILDCLILFRSGFFSMLDISSSSMVKMVEVLFSCGELAIRISDVVGLIISLRKSKFL